tara:strand:- start:775 stop:1578 length:804 start_codon:yes stop_codon:yes gene_type:complete
MKITLFTSNDLRHNYLINFLANFCDKLFVIQESKTFLNDINNAKKQNSKILENYLKKVTEAQNKIFKEELVNKKNKKIIILPILYGDLNKLSLFKFKEFLNSDIYIVYGSSYIKGELIEFLMKKRAINIHAGVSPYYRGAGCNFWALYDGNPHLVGATIHLLSKGLDSGPILYHAMSDLKTNPFEYTMSTVKSAFHSIGERIKDSSILKIKPIFQDKNKEIRYSKKNDFNENVVKEYFKKEINLNSKNFDTTLLIEPFFLKKNDIFV